MAEEITDGRELLGIQDGEGAEETSADQPTEEEFSEAFTPSISLDSFQIADKTFQIRISNIKTQKLMAHSLASITDLIAKIDVGVIFDDFRKVFREVPEGEVEEDTEGWFLNVTKLIQSIIAVGGIENVTITIMDLFTGVVYAIARGQDGTVTLDWVEENSNFNDIQQIFFAQLEKDKIGGRVVDFLSVATRLVTTGTGRISLST